MKKVCLIFSAVVIGMIITACGGGASSAKAETDENQETSTVTTEPSLPQMQTDDAKAQAYKVFEWMVDSMQGRGWINRDPISDRDTDLNMVLGLDRINGEYIFKGLMFHDTDELKEVVQDPNRYYFYKIAAVEHVNDDGEIIDVEYEKEEGFYVLHTIGSWMFPSLRVVVFFKTPMKVEIQLNGRLIWMREIE